MILEQLRGGPQSVSAIARVLPVSQPAVSQHLKVLKEAGLVTVRKDGTSRIYAVDPAGLVPVRAYLDSFWDEALGAFVDAADAKAARDALPDRSGEEDA
jgi:DNA-binding transcriptional ArsR family regulator